MFKPGRDDDDFGAVPIELIGFGGPEESEADVSFGGRTPKHPRTPAASKVRRRIAAGAVAAIAVGAFIVGGAGDPKGASPPPVIPSATTRPASERSSSAASVGLESPASIAAVVTAPPSTAPSVGPLYTNDRHLGLYLIGGSNDGASSLVRVDLSSGNVETVISPTLLGQHQQVLGVSRSGDVVVPVVDTSDNGQSASADGPDGTIWLFGGVNTDLRQVRYQADGSYQVLNVVPGLRSNGVAILIGSTAELRPVVRLADSRAYAVDPATGAVSRLTEGSTTRFEHGYFGESLCTADGNCVLRLHGFGDPRDVGQPGGFIATLFSPDGHTVLVMSQSYGPSTGTTATLIDLTTGSQRPVTLLTQTFYSDSNVVWAPDSSAVFWLEIGTLSLNRLTIATRVTVHYDLSKVPGVDYFQGIGGIA